MNKINLKKYSGLSLLMGGVLTLSGCGVVANAGNDGYSEGSVIVTTESTTEPYAYAGYGYKEYMKNEGKSEVESTTVPTTTEPFAYAGYGYKEYMKNQEVTTEPITEATTEPYAYAGYGYKQYIKEQEELAKQEALATDISYSTMNKSMDEKYAYYRHDDFYKVTDNDSIGELCERFNITMDELYAHNPKLGAYPIGQSIAYPVLEELYIGHAGDDINEISIETGVDVNVIKTNNMLNLSGSILNEDSQILLHKFVGNENSYVTNKGVVNIINNNRVYGSKVVQARGFAGATGHYLALQEDVYSYGVNQVVAYSFNGDNRYSINYVCFNAKDIIVVDGLPVAILRNDADIKDLADSVNVEVDDMAYMQWGSYAADGYSVCTNGDNSYVIMNGMDMDLDLGKSYSKRK